jgi:hypothetical protein
MPGRVASWCRDHPLLTACLLVAAGAGSGFAASVPASGELNDALVVASTTLVFGALLGGAVKFLLEDLQRLRDQRADSARFVKQVLDDLKSVYDRVERVRILIAAHQSALTYGREMRDLIDSAVQLRNVARALDQTSGIRSSEGKLKAAVSRMTDYVDSLTREFRLNYKGIADKQAVYEVQAKRARETEEPVPLPHNEAWADMSRLSQLAEFLGNASKPSLDYERDFRKALEVATWILRAELRRLADGSRPTMPLDISEASDAIAKAPPRLDECTRGSRRA